MRANINRLNRNRGVATRYDNFAVRYEATIHITAINEWLHSLRGRPWFVTGHLDRGVVARRYSSLLTVRAITPYCPCIPFLMGMKWKVQRCESS